MLKREQDRIVAELDQVTRRIDAHFGDYAEARAHLDDALGLLGDCADIYTRCDDTNRRLCNQAFFTKVFIDEDNELRVEHNRPFEMQLDPQVNANALTWAADMEQGPNLDQRFHWQGFEPCAWGGPEGTRTPDPLHAMQVRYQLRHRPGWSRVVPEPPEFGPSASLRWWLLPAYATGLRWIWTLLERSRGI